MYEDCKIGIKGSSISTQQQKGYLNVTAFQQIEE